MNICGWALCFIYIDLSVDKKIIDLYIFSGWYVRVFSGAVETMSETGEHSHLSGRPYSARSGHMDHTG